MEINIRILKPTDNRKGFSCGEIELDYFFQKYAGQNQFKHYIGSTYIATDEETVLGFVTVSVGDLSRDLLPEQLRKRVPNYPLPILKITRMGVAIPFQHQGIGKKLLKAMFLLSIEQSHSVGCVGITVDAKEEAIAFYNKLGFIELNAIQGLPKRYINQTPLFLALDTIKKAL